MLEDYIVLSAPSDELLRKAVLNFLDEKPRWVTAGGVSVVRTDKYSMGNGLLYTQALVLYT